MHMRMDPFEEADRASFNYWAWRAERVYMLSPAGALVFQFMQTMVEFPVRQHPDSWTPAAMLEKLQKSADTLKSAAHAG